MQVRVWSVVEGYATAAARIQAALDDDMPHHLAEARDQLEEARREHDALQQAVEGKVGWGWRGSAVEGSGQRVQQRGQQMHKPGIDTWSFAWARVPEKPPILLWPNALQTQFIASYNERSAQLLAEAEELKARHRAAHKEVRAAEAKMGRLREALTEAQAQKEVSCGHRQGWLWQPTPGSEEGLSAAEAWHSMVGELVVTGP